MIIQRLRGVSPTKAKLAFANTFCKADIFSAGSVQFCQASTVPYLRSHCPAEQQAGRVRQRLDKEMKGPDYNTT